MEFKGMLSSVDFKENEITIKVVGEIQIKYGKYVVMDSEKFESTETSKKELLEALIELIELKKIKFNDGEYPSEEYRTRKPIAWENAQKAIEKALKID